MITVINYLFDLMFDLLFAYGTIGTWRKLCF